MHVIVVHRLFHPLGQHRDYSKHLDFTVRLATIASCGAHRMSMMDRKLVVLYFMVTLYIFIIVQLHCLICGDRIFLSYPSVPSYSLPLWRHGGICVQAYDDVAMKAETRPRAYGSGVHL